MIQANRLDRGFFKYQKEFEDKAIEVLRSGWYILGKEVSSFEESFAEYTGAKYCVGLASGLDALILAFRALKIGKGDEVIVQGNTYIASVMGITINGATPVFVEPDEYYNIDPDRIEEKITERTKAVLVVHLYGQASDMGRITEICKKHSLKLVEDCAQSHGSCFEGKMTGTFGDIGCFSFYPSKNIGAFGDAGAVVCDDESLSREIKMLRNYGSEKRYYNKTVGMNSRLDELQAGLLRVRLSHAEELNAEKKEIAERYDRELDNPCLILPKVRKGCDHIYHQYVIRLKDRERFIGYLTENGIGSIIHYPIPPHLSEAYGYLGLKRGSLPVTERFADEVLSIPMYNGMYREEQDKVIEVINGYKGSVQDN
ncbi:MAG: DegT/DnrJ/EryC1/StrS family aminotransferase [Lachnospiraceae bacterium]|nr:DegT/DnrJ/EryC1/StrS family aminotransferase [Lachnospiraceae bacterium]